MMRIVLRNITNNTEKELHLPIDDEKLKSMLNENCEYLIVDHDPILDVDEYECVTELNELLQECIRKNIDTDTLVILSVLLLYGEVKECISNNSYQIIKFSDYMPNGDYNTDEDRGRALYEADVYNPFAVSVPKELLDWIDWADVWRNAECNGWATVRYKNSCYLVKV